jgi:hypothetical protein
MLSFAEARQVRVNRGDDRALVTEIDLYLAEVLPLLEQMRRVTVAQGMDVRRLGDGAGLEGQTEGALERGAAHRFGSGTRALSAVPLGGKEQDGMTVRFPLLAQEHQRALGQGDVAVLIAFTGADVQEPALRIDVADLQSKRFPQAQAAGVNGDQTDAMIQCGNRGEDLPDFGGGEHDGQFELGIGTNQFQFVRPGPVESFFPKQLDGANGLGAGLAGDLLVGLQVDAILANVLRREQFRRAAVELTELADAGVVGLFGARADGQELQVIGKGFQDGVRGTFFICMAVLLRLMVDRRASAYAGLRSASLGERTAKANNQRTKSCEAAKSSFPDAAERLRSTRKGM